MRLRIWAMAGAVLLVSAAGWSGTTRAAVQAAPGQGSDKGQAASKPYAGDPSGVESPGREQRLGVNRVMDLLKITPGRSVADIGAESGWFTVRAARRVGPGGVVYAEDINPAALEYIDQRAAAERLGNVRTVLGSAADPRLPDDSMDAVMMLNVYHEIARPIELLHRLRPALRPGGLIGVIDKRGNGSGKDHGVPEETVVREMAAEGFVEVGRYDFVKADGEDYFIVFRER